MPRTPHPSSSLVAPLALAAASLLMACGDDGGRALAGEASNPPQPLTIVAAEVCQPDCGGRECGYDGCFGQCGVCGPGAACDDAGQCAAWTCEADCVGRECGPDGCGGTCGSCAAGAHCLQATGQCKVDPCQGVPYEGCCEGDVLTWCSSGELVTVDCVEAPACGWTGVEYDCGTSGGSDPAGKFPRPCDGDCSCEGKVCGDDGCGDPCGTCPAGELCQGGLCALDACQGVPYEGCCDDDTGALVWCEAGELVSIDCTDSPVCGWSEEAGYYDCGTDGVGEPSGAFPLSCGLDCEPECGAAECGSDGCGGSCGDCAAGETCAAGTCVDAGDDPCGGIPYEGCCDAATLTWCEEGELLTIECAPDDLECGWSAADGFYNCDTEGGADPAGTFPIECGGGGPSCTPDCGAAECGSDGCGGSCGTCPDGGACDDLSGQCQSVDPGPCQGVPFEGCCDSQTLTWCEDDELFAQDCGVDGLFCGWSADDGFYLCGTDGEPDPSGAFPLSCPALP